ncbi:PREDICTED: uncharacterized protein LOC105456305 [Wasmannia auropunctata]|uniref:uncharacterized protein LOC105456305 n=1 Tax=Wasmannia auropunctata TaxID=64793 RepID=UPI0005F0BA11|nr:PREDICTED: uncharacterized protein LOC105456305 [Wasmannia auropunctata]
MEQTIRDLDEQATRLITREHFIAWEERVDEFIDSLDEQTRNPQLSIGVRQSVIARIARLESLKDSVRGRFVQVGAGYGAELRWREIDAAFNSRILTGAFNPLHAGCHIQLPREIITKKAVVNVQFIGNACFAWSVVAALYLAKSHVDRESSYPHYKSVLNLKDIQFPMTLSQIKKFENLNAISINVYTIENVEQVSILPIRLADTKKEKHVNLLYVEKDGVGHFTWIKNLSRLVSSQLSKNAQKKYICDRCLHYFSSSEKLEVHTVDCGEMNECAIRLPSEDDKWLSFNNYSRKERVPFVVYADLECILTKMERDP